MRRRRSTALTKKAKSVLRSSGSLKKRHAIRSRLRGAATLKKRHAIRSRLRGAATGPWLIASTTGRQERRCVLLKLSAHRPIIRPHHVQSPNPRPRNAPGVQRNKKTRPPIQWPITSLSSRPKRTGRNQFRDFLVIASWSKPRVQDDLGVVRTCFKLDCMTELAAVVPGQIQRRPPLR